MKRLFLPFGLIFCITNLYAIEESIYEKFKGYPEIKIFLKDVINETKDSTLPADLFREVFRETIEKRKGIRFVYSNDVKNADVIVIVKIKNYVFTEKAMPMMFSSATLVADSLSPKSSGKLVVDYEIKDRKGETLLFYKNFTTEERRPQDHMKGESGFIYSTAKSVNRFIYKAFYKPKNR